MTFKREGPGTKRLLATLDGLDGVEGKVGWFETARYPGKSAPPVAYIATIQEFGYPEGGIPARPFMRPAVAENGPGWLKLIGQAAKHCIKTGYSPKDALEQIMLKAAGDVAKKIQAVTSPELSPRTVAKRKNKSTKPLVDTGQMIQAVTGKVEGVGEGTQG